MQADLTLVGLQVIFFGLNFQELSQIYANDNRNYKKTMTLNNAISICE